MSEVCDKVLALLLTLILSCYYFLALYKSQFETVNVGRVWLGPYLVVIEFCSTIEKTLDRVLVLEALLCVVEHKKPEV